MSEQIENRTRTVLEAAMRLASAQGMAAVTRPRIADEAGVAVGTVSNAYGSMDALRDAVMATAVEREILPVVLYGVVNRHPAALAAPESLRQRALAAA